MHDQLQLFELTGADAEGVDLNPYVVTWLRSLGVSWPVSYMLWVQEKWGDYKKHLGLSPDTYLTRQQKNGFASWLNNHVDELVTRPSTAGDKE